MTFPLEAQLAGGYDRRRGLDGVTFGDFGVAMPSAPIVVAVEDNGILELQLFLTGAA